LRTATRRSKRSDPPPKPGETPEHHRARTTHNIAEKEYRQRLQRSFQQLLDALPDIMEGTGDGSRQTWRKQHRQMSKVDVLTETTRVLEFLESDNRRIKAELEQLKGNRREHGMFTVEETVQTEDEIRFNSPLG
jgi:hypothetical protein